MQWAANPTIVPEQRGTFLPASIPPHVLGTQPAAQPALPGVIHAPWQAFQNLWQAATDERNGGVPNDQQNARNAFDVAGAATTGGFTAGRLGSALHGPSMVPELPSTAAFRVGDKVYRGFDHSTALGKAEAEMGRKGLWRDWDSANGWKTHEEGYLSNRGNFLGRQDAADMIDRVGLDSNAIVGGLHSSRLRDLQTEHPSLWRSAVESGWPDANAIGSSGGSGKAKPPALPPSLIDAPRMVSGEVLDAVAPTAAAEMQSPHWPKSWFEGTAAGPDTIERAKLFVRDMDARDRVNAIIEPIMYPNGERAMSRAEAEKIAMRNPEHAAVLQDAYQHKTNLYEHANPKFESDPYGPVNYPSPPGDTSRADAFVGRLDAGLQRASGLAEQARAAGMPLPEQPFLLDRGMSAVRRQGLIK